MITLVSIIEENNLVIAEFQTDTSNLDDLGDAMAQWHEAFEDERSVYVTGIGSSPEGDIQTWLAISGQQDAIYDYMNNRE